MIFTTLVADPPWQYRDLVHAARTRLVKAADYGFGADKIRGRRGAEGYYPTMTVDAICALGTPATRMYLPQVAGHDVADDAHLYLWTTNAFMEAAHGVARAWGFESRTILTWVKPQIGMGYYFRNNTEHVIFAVRGRLPLRVHNQPTAFTAARTRRHSEKPQAFYEIVERCSPGPYLELFARAPRLGWARWGNEAEAGRAD